jgi:4-methyl-5(b-hydroxyethyl)-thiazole monophosphate biosynthesis
MHSSIMSNKKRVLVPIADGTEEIEAVTIIDTLRRGGADVHVASVMGKKEVRCAHDTQITADWLITECTGEGQNWDLIVCPGGQDGAEHLSQCSELIDLLKRQQSEGKLLAAICASPSIVFAKHGLINGPATCYHGEKFTSLLGPHYDASQGVVRSGNVFTSKGPGTALEFSLQLVAELFGREREIHLKEQMECHW